MGRIYSRKTAKIAIFAPKMTHSLETKSTLLSLWFLRGGARAPEQFPGGSSPLISLLQSGGKLKNFCLRLGRLERRTGTWCISAFAEMHLCLLYTSDAADD